jgi:poly-gamma-glutamate capsule biosynthesis protein CapA/YwtB (metallophosphatase superfamily)
MMGSTHPTPVLPPDDGCTMFRAVRRPLAGADVLFGNLEGPLIDGGTPQKCAVSGIDKARCFEFRMPVRYALHLKKAGFTAIGIANNHVNDFGTEGLATTLKTLQAVGIRAVGGMESAVLNVKGRKIAFLGFSFMRSPGSASILDIQAATAMVRKLKKDNSLILVSFHGGAEGPNAMRVSDTWERFAWESRGNVVRFARAVVDAGADMVIGHGPHVLRAMELYKGKLIAYSLGNFLTYGRFNLRGPGGMSVILKADIDGETGEFMAGELVPLALRDGGIPFVDDERRSVRLMKELTEEYRADSGLVIQDNGRFYAPDSFFRGTYFSSILKRSIKKD